MLDYPIQIEPDGDGFLITCPDLPEVTSDAESEGDAATRATDAVEEALAGRLSAFEDIPRPTAGSVRSAPVASLLALKVALFWRLTQVGETRAGLARRLDWHRNSVDRLFDPRHGTKLEQFDAAFDALGAHTPIAVEVA